MERGVYQPAPGVWDGMPVSAEKFRALPRPPGWKYERWSGVLRLEPDWRYEVARWVGPSPDDGIPPVVIETARPKDIDALVEAASEAFADGPDYFCAPAEGRRQDLRRDVEDAFALEPEWVQAAHSLARASTGETVGLLLVREVEGGVTLQSVGVRSEWRRKGVAASLLRSALNALPDGTDVRSGWLVANRESGDWHRRVGFAIVPTSVAARSRLTSICWERREGVAAARAEVERLEADEREKRGPDPFSFARPIHRRPRSVG